MRQIVVIIKVPVKPNRCPFFNDRPPNQLFAATSDYLAPVLIYDTVLSTLVNIPPARLKT